MIEIRHRTTGEVLHRLDTNALAGADLTGINLCDADLTGMDLRGTILTGSVCRFTQWSGANLSRADLRTITWREVDLEAGLICRPRHKTGTRLRLPMSAPLREILKRQRFKRGLVCPRLPKDEGSLYKALHRLCRRAGIPTGGWHRLRHTAATLLASAGTDVATIGRILGHRPGSVVTLRYLHTDDDRLREAADAVASAIGGGLTRQPQPATH